MFTTTAGSPSNFVPCRRALEKTASAAANTSGAICLPCRSRELSRGTPAESSSAIVVRPEWTREENRAAVLLTTSGDAADGLHICAFAMAGRDCLLFIDFDVRCSPSPLRSAGRALTRGSDKALIGLGGYILH